MATPPTTPEQSSSSHAAPCGKPRRDGTPCQIRVIRPPMEKAVIEQIDAAYGPRACSEHAGQSDRVLAAIIDSVWATGYRYGMLVKAGTAPRPSTASAPEATPVIRAGQQARQHVEPQSVPRERDERGRQLVLASGGYTYHWNDPCGNGDLHPGDVVLLPANAVDPKPHEGVVESVGSSYGGQTKAVLHLVRRAP